MVYAKGNYMNTGLASHYDKSTSSHVQHLASVFPKITMTKATYFACNAQGYISCLKLRKDGKYLSINAVRRA
jgi:hypothetical protein